MNGTIAGIVLAGSIGFAMVGQGVISTVGGWTAPPRALTVTQLEFIDGEFHQITEPIGQGSIRADWAAKIETGDGKFVCGGGATSTYGRRSVPLVMTPDDWTGDTCDLLPGKYKAKALWEFRKGDRRP